MIKANLISISAVYVYDTFHMQLPSVIIHLITTILHHQNHPRASFTFWCLGTSGNSSKIFFVLARPVEGLLAVYRNFRKCSQEISQISVLFLTFQSFNFENLSHSRASSLTNIYILIREVLEKQTTAALYCMFSF